MEASKKLQKQRKNSLDLGTMVYGKIPPQAKDLEEAVLGAILLESDAIEKASGILKAECFYVETHQRIYRVMMDMAGRGIPIDLLTVAEELRKRDELDLVGGPYYVTKLTNAVASSANIEVHCRIILQKYIQREIIRISGELISAAYEDASDPLELLSDAEDQLSRVTDSYSFGDMVPIDAVLVKAIQQIEEYRQMNEEWQGGLMVTGIPSGFKDLDMATRGWQSGDLIILAARPSVGKTAFVLNLLLNAAEHLKDSGSVAIWSLEMKSTRLMFRLLAATSRIWLTKLQTGKLTTDDMKQIYRDGIQRLAKLSIFLDEHPGLTIQKLRTKARRLKRKNKLKLIVIDYLQLMTPDENSRANREQEISKISRELKKLAQELDIPIIALSQLSRAVESRAGGKPQLSDLRESGAIEQDADVVMFLYGESEEAIEEARQQGNYDSVAGRKYLKIAKQRDGMLITAELQFKGDLQLFEQGGEGIGGQSGWKPANLKPVSITSNSNFYEKEKDEDLPF